MTNSRIYMERSHNEDRSYQGMGYHWNSTTLDQFCSCHPLTSPPSEASTKQKAMEKESPTSKGKGPPLIRAQFSFLIIIFEESVQEAPGIPPQKLLCALAVGFVLWRPPILILLEHTPGYLTGTRDLLCKIRRELDQCDGVNANHCCPDLRTVPRS